MQITKWNYIVPIRLFLHYLFGSGESLKVELKEYKEVPKYSALYMALGHYDYSRGEDIYDFNPGEWPAWLINIGVPYKITWDIKNKV